MEFRFFDRGDDELIATSEIDCEKGIVVALRTTGYSAERDEVVELAMGDLGGNTLFAKRVKPQNVEQWLPSEASGGLSPADVEACPELYQFEDEVVALFEGAGLVVAQHAGFARKAIEASWVSLPDFEGIDLVELFCQTHCTSSRPDKPAAAAALPDIAAYYSLPAPDGSLEGEVALVAACLRALVDEHKRVREEKGETYWRRYEEERADERAVVERQQAAARMRERRMSQMNGLLWIAGAIIFASLAIQLYQRGFDAGAIIICGAVSAFALIRGIVNMRK